MKVKVVKECWYGEKHYTPELEVKDIIIEYPCEKAEDLPTWAEPATAKEIKNTEGGDDNNGNGKTGETKGKVKDLPVAEKNLLIEKAAKVGITGNQILSWKVETLEANIAKKEEELKNNTEGGDDNNGGNDEGEGKDE